ncbi:MAG: HupE/UreJ family protein [Bacteroidetes bacterium]|nr:HupE/UreJ family protein [Bacteroidota bacterium]MDA1268402.1 HupE/UreJ family protein [Bacteroidota bacterium]
MTSFELYFKLGLKHILDLHGFDHILFIIAICAVYVARDWVKILLLVTAFTLGHSLTLALATFQIIQIRSEVIEFLIPITIAFTALVTLVKPKTNSGKGIQLHYLLALFFGLIHGLGFSNYLRSLLGKEASIWQQLLAFNVGLEVGQLVIVAAFLLLTTLVHLAGMNRKEWTLIVSAFILGVASMLMLQTKFW